MSARDPCLACAGARGVHGVLHAIAHLSARSLVLADGSARGARLATVKAFPAMNLII